MFTLHFPIFPAPNFTLNIDSPNTPKRTRPLAHTWIVTSPNRTTPRLFCDDATGRKCKEWEERPVGTRREHGAAAAARRSAALSRPHIQSLERAKIYTFVKYRLLTETFI